MNSSGGNATSGNGITNPPTAKECKTVFAHFFPELYGSPKQIQETMQSLDNGSFAQKRKAPPEFEIKIHGMPSQYDQNEFKTYLSETLGLQFQKVHWPTLQRRDYGSRPPWVWISFNSEEEKEKAISVIHGQIWKENVLRVTGGLGKPDDESLNYARKKPRTNLRRMNTAMKTEFATQEEAMKYGHMPFFDVPYQQQKQKMEENLKEELKKLGSSLLDEWKGAPTGSQMVSYYEQQTGKNNGLPCQFAGVLPPPKTEGFLDNHQFSIGTDQNDVKTVGLFVRQMNVVAPITADVVTLPPRMKEAVWAFQKYIQKSALDVLGRRKSNQSQQLGHWSKFTVRTGYSNKQMCFTINFVPRQLSSEEMDQVKKDLITYFTNGEGKQSRPTSMYLQLGVSPKAPLERIYGDEYMTETLCGVKISIHPQPVTPFYKNLGYAEQMYKCVADLLGVNKTTTLLDINCGIGALGLSMARRAGEVIGIEMRKALVDVAVKNAQLNKFANCQFLNGIVEVVLPTLLPKLKFNNIVAVIDSPNSPLPPQVFGELRKVKNLTRIVILCFSPDDFSDLCRPQTKLIQGDPFVPVKCVAFDTFPHTSTHRLVVLLERFPPRK